MQPEYALLLNEDPSASCGDCSRIVGVGVVGRRNGRSWLCDTCLLSQNPVLAAPVVLVSLFQTFAPAMASVRPAGDHSVLESIAESVRTPDDLLNRFTQRFSDVKDVETRVMAAHDIPLLEEELKAEGVGEQALNLLLDLDWILEVEADADGYQLPARELMAERVRLADRTGVIPPLRSVPSVPLAACGGR